MNGHNLGRDRAEVVIGEDKVDQGSVGATELVYVARHNKLLQGTRPGNKAIQVYRAEPAEAGGCGTKEAAGSRPVRDVSKGSEQSKENRRNMLKRLRWDLNEDHHEQGLAKARRVAR